LQLIFGKADLKFDAYFTEKVGDATRIAKEKIEAGYHKIIVVGRRWTLNEVVNGIFFSEICINNRHLTGYHTYRNRK